MGFTGALTRTQNRLARRMGEMPDRCDSYEPPAAGTETTDGFGEIQASSSEPVFSGEPCLVIELKGEERIVAAGQANVGDFVVTMKFSRLSQLTPRSKLVVRARGPLPERTLYVQVPLDGGAYASVLCKKTSDEVTA